MDMASYIKLTAQIRHEREKKRQKALDELFELKKLAMELKLLTPDLVTNADDLQNNLDLNEGNKTQEDIQELREHSFNTASTDITINLNKSLDSLSESNMTLNEFIAHKQSKKVIRPNLW